MTQSVRDPLDVHVARIMLLVEAFSTRDDGRLEGLSKLARLDFLLRYPVYLERIVRARGRKLPFELWPTSAEQVGVESTMTRHRYGPFDTRYYELIGRLVGMGLCEQLPRHRIVSLRATAAGRAAGDALIGPQWQTVRGRALVLQRALNISGKKLGELIDDQLPTRQTRPWTVLSAR